MFIVCLSTKIHEHHRPVDKQTHISEHFLSNDHTVSDMQQSPRFVWSAVERNENDMRSDARPSVVSCEEMYSRTEHETSQTGIKAFTRRLFKLFLLPGKKNMLLRVNGYAAFGTERGSSMRLQFSVQSRRLLRQWKTSKQHPLV